MQAVKNKKLTYLLICAVIVVWGIVLYRVFASQQEDDFPVKSKMALEKKDSYDQYIIKEDTFKLALNYKDPFFGAEEPEVKTVNLEPQTINVIPPPFDPPINWEIIKYLGYVVNPDTKKLVSIVSINGNERMLSDGEFLEGVKLLRNKRDSILVSWQGKKKYIKR